MAADVEPERLEEPAVAAGVMFAETVSFGDTAERLLEVMLVVIVGVAVAVHWDPRSIPLAIALFVVIRPLTAWLTLAGTPTTGAQRWLMGWFGIRGIGSLYYLAYAVQPRDLGRSRAGDRGAHDLHRGAQHPGSRIDRAAAARAVRAEARGRRASQASRLQL